MTQVTWRAPEQLVESVRQAAAGEGYSLNEYLTRLARAATDPALADSDLERLRERLARAGLLVPAGPQRRRPEATAVERARGRAGQGTQLSRLVTDERR